MPQLALQQTRPTSQIVDPHWPPPPHGDGPVPGVQIPARHVSPTVQTLPSSQLVPSGMRTKVQIPLFGSHTPGPLQGPGTIGQITGAPPTQLPAIHVS